jgi:triosephosphate isomerase
LYSATQVKDFGLNWVILGHSERRKTFGETDKVGGNHNSSDLAILLQIIGEKVAMALKAGAADCSWNVFD